MSVELTAGMRFAGFVKGDVPGHPFRGNQYTDVAGEAPAQEGKGIFSRGEEKGRASLYDYVHGQHKVINNCMRHGDCDNETRKMIFAMGDLFDAKGRNVGPEGATVYRGMNVKKFAGWRTGEAAIGAVITDEGFVSTSEDVEVARNFAHREPGGWVGDVMEVRLHSKVRYLPVGDLLADDEYESEKEWLLSPGKFVITGFHTEAGLNVYTAEYRES